MAESTGNAPEDAHSKEWIHLQKKVFFKWIHYFIKSQDSTWVMPTNEHEKDLLEELKDGVLLARLARAVTEKPSEFPPIVFDDRQKTPFAVMGRLDKVLTFLKTREGLNITATGQDLFNGNEVQVMGLIWVMILKYQNITRNELLGWIREKISSSPSASKLGLDVRNFTDNWTNGLALCALLAAVAPAGSIDLQACEAMQPLERLAEAFRVAESTLFVPKLLEPSDIYPNKPHERIMMTYLSFFRNIELKPKTQPQPKVVAPVQSDQSDLIAQLRAEIERLKSTVGEKDVRIVVLEKEIKEKDTKIVYIEKEVLVDRDRVVELEKEVEHLKKDHALELQRQVHERDEIIKDLRENQLVKLKTDLGTSERNLVAVRRELDRIETTELSHLRHTVEAQAAEIEMLKQKNKNLISDMKTEVMKLLKRQQEDAETMGILKSKVANYSTKIIELQQLIQEKGLTNVDELENELRKMAIKNEELLKKIAALEKEIHEAQRSAEKLMASIQSEDDGGSGVSLKDQLEKALEQIRDLLEWRKRALNEIHDLRDKQAEMQALLSQMDKLVKTAVKNKAGHSAANQRAWQQLQQLIAWSNDKLDELTARVDEFTENVQKPLGLVITTAATAATTPAQE